MNKSIQHLIQKFSQGTISLKEQIELSEQLADRENREVEEILSQDWEKALKSTTNSDQDFSPVLHKIHHQIRLNEANVPHKLDWWKVFQRTAAILILPLLFTFSVYIYFQKPGQPAPVTYAEIQCPLGVRTKFLLPDGSTGFLNSGSRLKYPVQFIGERQVELVGEAFFEVVHNENNSFHVHTPNLDIKVLGTVFNVIANDDEDTEEIVLQNGKVDISTATGNQLAVLKPNEKLTLNIENQSFVKDEVEASQYTSWKDGQLVFRNENMQQVAHRLSRWYNAEVVVDDQMLKDYTFHATFIDEPLDEVLKLLSITTPLSFSEEKRESDADGIFQKRKVVLRINPLKINQFK
jgi:ferric-dicitrate binding protein FerR (iron transport regulator)